MERQNLMKYIDVSGFLFILNALKKVVKFTEVGSVIENN